MAQQRKQTELSNFLVMLKKPTHVNNEINLSNLPLTLPDGKILILFSGSYKVSREVQGFQLSLGILKQSHQVICPQLTVQVYMKSSDTSRIYIVITKSDGSTEEITSSATSAFKSAALLKDYTSFKAIVVTLVNELRLGLPNPVLYGWR